MGDSGQWQIGLLRDCCRHHLRDNNTTIDDLGDLGMQVKMINNDAYTENAAQVCSSMGINAIYNEAYMHMSWQM